LLVTLKGANNTIVSSELPIPSQAFFAGSAKVSVFARRAGGGPLISLAYLICRSLFRLLVRALGRIDDKDVEIVVLRHQLESSIDRTAGTDFAHRTGCCWQL
jgi:hypothetical protein